MNKSNNLRLDLFLIIIFCIGYLVLSVSVANHYGMTWDQAEADWFVAEKNLDYLLSFDKSHLDFEIAYEYQPYPDHPRFFCRVNPWGVMYFGNFLSAIGCRVFFAGLRIVADPFTAHYIPNFLMITAVLAIVYFFIKRRWGVLCALISLSAIIFQPRFFAGSHINTKDIPYACLMTFTLFSARKAVLTRSGGWMFFSAVLFGLSTATKLNSPLILAIILLWVLFSYRDIQAGYFDKIEYSKKIFFTGAIISIPFVAFLSFLAVWPYMWLNTFSNISKYLGHYLSLAGKGPPCIQWNTLFLFISVQPPIMLVFGFVGIIVCLRNILLSRHREEMVFLMLWFVLPVGRMLLPRMYNFDGVRHFIEYAIPWGIINGIGVNAVLNVIVEFAKNRWGKIFGYTIEVVLPGFFIAWLCCLVYYYHPYEIAYFNFLVGGLKGAQEKWDDAGDYWGSSYRNGVKWFNENAEIGALILTPISGYIILANKEQWLRKDLRLAILEFQDTSSAEEVVRYFNGKGFSSIYAIYITRKGWYNRFVNDVERKWKQVHTIEVDGYPILKIMKYQ